MNKGNISIGRPHGDNCDYINIEISDESSGIHFVEARVKYSEFAKLITGLSYVDCELITRGLHLVGTVREHKTVDVFMPDGERSTREERARAAIAAHETDKWKGRTSDVLNHHRQIGRRGDDGAWYKVGFVRHVDPQPEPPATERGVSECACNITASGDILYDPLCPVHGL